MRQRVVVSASSVDALSERRRARADAEPEAWLERTFARALAQQPALLLIDDVDVIASKRKHRDGAQRSAVRTPHA